MTYSNVTRNVVTATGFSPDEHVEPFQTSTMTCMVLPHELVFVDCGIIPKIASEFRSDMEERFQKDTSHLLLTHVHWDHIFGMEAFEDVRIVASTVGITYLKRNLKGMFSRERREKTAKRRFSNRKEIAECCKNAKLLLPHIGVTEELRIGPKEEVIFKVIEGHSKDSACIYAPEEQVLCTGDNLLTYYAQLPGNPRETLEIFGFWETLDINYVIPGHGDVVRKEYITMVRTYFEELLSVLKILKAQHLPLKDVLNHPSLPHYFGKDQPTWTEGGKYHTEWLEKNVKSWYKWLATSPKF